MSQVFVETFRTENDTWHLSIYIQRKNYFTHLSNCPAWRDEHVLNRAKPG